MNYGIKSLCISLLVLLLTWISFAQNAKESNLGDISIRFCNDSSIIWWSKSLELSTEANKEEDLCIYLKNSGPTDLKVGINFVDGTFTAWPESKKACLPEWEKTLFWQYVQAETTEFLVPAQWTLQTRAKLLFPEWYAGFANGCITTFILGEASNSWMIQVFSRRANFIDAYVSGAITQWLSYTGTSQNSEINILDHTSIKLYKRLTNKSMGLQYGLFNTWNTPVISSGHILVKFWWITLRNIDTVSNTISSQWLVPVDIDMPRIIKYLAGPISISLETDYSVLLPKTAQTEDINITQHQIRLNHSQWLRNRYCIVIIFWILGIWFIIAKKQRTKYDLS